MSPRSDSRFNTTDFRGYETGPELGYESEYDERSRSYEPDTFRMVHPALTSNKSNRFFSPMDSWQVTRSRSGPDLRIT